MRAGFVDFKSDTAYRNLDVMYMELLKIGLDNPRFISRDLTSNYMSHFEGEELLRYGHFAFMTWNICESIYDQRDEINISKTWNPILRVENRLHRRWFECEQNRIGFKQEFQEFVLHELTREAL
jgi:hypothetical protein